MTFGKKIVYVWFGFFSFKIQFSHNYYCFTIQFFLLFFFFFLIKQNSKIPIIIRLKIETHERRIIIYFFSKDLLLKIFFMCIRIEKMY